ncbi:TPA: hypothetical protein ACH3X1_008800 [Trebouxia sp. C0004]
MTCSPIASCSLRSLQVGQAVHLSGTPESLAANCFSPAALAHQSQLEQPSRRQHRNQILRRNCHTNFRSFKSRQLLVHMPAIPVSLLSIALTEESPAWTLDQIAGLVFGGIMLASVLLAAKVDVFIARAQRRDLGLCEECGGLDEPETCDSGKCPYKQKHS